MQLYHFITFACDKSTCFITKYNDLGNGKHTSVWFDNWSFLGPLCQFISKRDIFEAGLSLSCKISDVVRDGEWLWPSCWKTKFEFLFVLPPPLLFSDQMDKVLWKSRNDKVLPFSVNSVWSDLSSPKPTVPWSKIVWFSQNIPRNAFFPLVGHKSEVKYSR